MGGGGRRGSARAAAGRADAQQRQQGRHQQDAPFRQGRDGEDGGQGHGEVGGRLRAGGGGVAGRYHRADLVRERVRAGEAGVRCIGGGAVRVEHHGAVARRDAARRWRAERCHRGVGRGVVGQQVDRGRATHWRRCRIVACGHGGNGHADRDGRGGAERGGIALRRHGADVVGERIVAGIARVRRVGGGSVVVEHHGAVLRRGIALGRQSERGGRGIGRRIVGPQRDGDRAARRGRAGVVDGRDGGRRGRGAGHLAGCSSVRLRYGNVVQEQVIAAGHRRVVPHADRVLPGGADTGGSEVPGQAHPLPCARWGFGALQNSTKNSATAGAFPAACCLATFPGAMVGEAVGSRSTEGRCPAIAGCAKAFWPVLSPRFLGRVPAGRRRRERRHLPALGDGGGALLFPSHACGHGFGPVQPGAVLMAVAGRPEPAARPGAAEIDGGGSRCGAGRDGLRGGVHHAAAIAGLLAVGIAAAIDRLGATRRGQAGQCGGEDGVADGAGRAGRQRGSIRWHAPSLDRARCTGLFEWRGDDRPGRPPGRFSL